MRGPASPFCRCAGGSAAGAIPATASDCCTCTWAIASAAPTPYAAGPRGCVLAPQVHRPAPWRCGVPRSTVVINLLSTCAHHSTLACGGAPAAAGLPCWACAGPAPCRRSGGGAPGAQRGAHPPHCGGSASTAAAVEVLGRQHSAGKRGAATSPLGSSPASPPLPLWGQRLGRGGAPRRPPLTPPAYKGAGTALPHIYLSTLSNGDIVERQTAPDLPPPSPHLQTITSMPPPPLTRATPRTGPRRAAHLGAPPSPTRGGSTALHPSQPPEQTR